MNTVMTNRLKVMVADDHPIVCKGLINLIDGQNDLRVVAKAETSEEALTKALDLELDLLMLDLGLPGVGGMEVINQLRSKRPDLKILVLSVQPEDIYAELAIRAGARGYINKVSSPDKILIAVRTVLKGDLYTRKDILMDVVSSSRRNSSDKKRINRLTPREMQVMRLLVTGKRNCDIAKDLGISDRTVNTHRTRILEKLNVANLVELVELARQLGII